MFNEITYDVKDRVATITLNRPSARNAFTTQTQREIIAAAGVADADPGAMVVVVTGAGGTFCAGADIKELEEPEFQSPAGAEALLNLDFAYYDAIRRIGKPVVAAIEGFAVGGGCITAMMCDIRVATADARIGLPFVKIGLSGADGGVAYHLPRFIWYGRAAELLFAGETISGERAHRIGLVSYIAPPGKLQAKVGEVVEVLKSRSPLALRNTKIALQRSLDSTIADEFNFEHLITVGGLMSADWKEGTAAFKERRQPNFTPANRDLTLLR